MNSEKGIEHPNESIQEHLYYWCIVMVIKTIVVVVAFWSNFHPGIRAGPDGCASDWWSSFWYKLSRQLSVCISFYLFIVYDVFVSCPIKTFVIESVRSFWKENGGRWCTRHWNAEKWNKKSQYYSTEKRRHLVMNMRNASATSLM